MENTHYEITVRGWLGESTLQAFEGLSARSTPARTVLCGAIADQPALHAVLDQVESLGLDLLAVRATRPQGGCTCHRY
jgi:hypothetical protein